MENGTKNTALSASIKTAAKLQPKGAISNSSRLNFSIERILKGDEITINSHKNLGKFISSPLWVLIF